MTFTPHTYVVSEDPLIANLHLNRPLSADVLRSAILYREACIDRYRSDIDILKQALTRLLGLPRASPALQESARRVGAPAE